MSHWIQSQKNDPHNPHEHARELNLNKEIKPTRFSHIGCSKLHDNTKHLCLLELLPNYTFQANYNNNSNIKQEMNLLLIYVADFS